MSDAARAMPLYQGTKQLYATPMTRGDYNAYRGWNPPEGEDQTVPGYLVEYVDDGEPNDPRHKGYISWTPADVFERTYRQCDTFFARMLIESDDLSEKIAKLDSFMCGSDIFGKLDPVDRNLLIAQRDAMETYRTILNSRMSRTKEQTAPTAEPETVPPMDAGAPLEPEPDDVLRRQVDVARATFYRLAQIRSAELVIYQGKTLYDAQNYCAAEMDSLDAQLAAAGQQQ